MSFANTTFCDGYSHCKKGRYCEKAANATVYHAAEELGKDVILFEDMPSCYDPEEVVHEWK